MVVPKWSTKELWQTIAGILIAVGIVVFAIFQAYGNWEKNGTIKDLQEVNEQQANHIKSLQDLKKQETVKLESMSDSMLIYRHENNRIINEKAKADKAHQVKISKLNKSIGKLENQVAAEELERQRILNLEKNIIYENGN